MRNRSSGQERVIEQGATSKQPNGGAAGAASPRAGDVASSRFGKFLLFERLSAEGRRETRRARAAIRGYAVRLTKMEISGSELSYFFPVFVEEMSRAGFLFHRAIHPILEFGQIEGTPFYTSEDFEGLDLRSLLVECRRQRVPLPIPCALFIAREIAGALAYAHARRWSSGESLGVLHGALVPQKVFITAAGETKVSGFGLFRSLNRVALLRNFIDEASAEYLPPETVSRSVSDARTDVYGCGALLYAMLTFRSPRETALQQGRPSPPSSLRARVSPAVDALCRLALSDSVADRSLDAAELEQELGRILATEAPGFVPTDLAAFLHSLQDGSAQLALEMKRKSRLMNDPRREQSDAEIQVAPRAPMPWTLEGASAPMTASVETPAVAASPTATGRGAPAVPAGAAPSSSAAPSAIPARASGAPPRKRTMMLVLVTVAIAALATAGVLAWWFATRDDSSGSRDGRVAPAPPPEPAKSWPGVKPVAPPSAKPPQGTAPRAPVAPSATAQPAPSAAQPAAAQPAAAQPAAAQPAPEVAPSPAQPPAALAQPAPAPPAPPQPEARADDPFPTAPVAPVRKPAPPPAPKARPGVWASGAPGPDDSLATDERPAPKAPSAPAPAPAPEPSAETKPEPAPEPAAEPAPAPAPEAAPAPAPKPAAASVGYLTLTSDLYAQVTIDGRIKASTPLMKRALSPGTHKLVLFNPDNQLTQTIEIEVTAGATTKRHVKWGDGE